MLDHANVHVHVHTFVNFILLHIGKIDEYLKKERELYDAQINEAKKRQKVISSTTIPLSDGIVIFDEVKVSMNLQWNSRNDSLIGYTMTRDDLSSLCDVYQLLDGNYKSVINKYIPVL